MAIPVVDADPALYSYTLDGVIQRAVAENSSGEVTGPARRGGSPLLTGEPGVIYANSLGVTEPALPAGKPAPASPRAVPQAKVEVYINGVRQRLRSVTLVPGEIGVFRISFDIAPETPVHPQDDNRVWIRIGTRESARLVIELSRSDAATGNGLDVIGLREQVDER